MAGGTADWGGLAANKWWCGGRCGVVVAGVPAQTGCDRGGGNVMVDGLEQKAMAGAVASRGAARVCVGAGFLFGVMVVVLAVLTHNN